MNDYLNRLEKSLRRMGAQERKEIIADYREHFEIGLESGKTIEQIITSLGDPSELAKMYTALGATNRAHETKGIKDTLHMLGAIARFKMPARGATTSSSESSSSLRISASARPADSNHSTLPSAVDIYPSALVAMNTEHFILITLCLKLERIC